MDTAKKKTIKLFAKRLERSTIYSSKTIEAIAEKFDYLGTEELERVLLVISDFAAAFATDLWTASNRVREALQTENLKQCVTSMMKRYGSPRT